MISAAKRLHSQASDRIFNQTVITMSHTMQRRVDYGRDKEFDHWDIDDLSITTIRPLAMDAVQRADSGHPGTPVGLAPAAYVLWKRFMRHNPHNPKWFNRDRFVLSVGHASMLHMCGYDVPLEEIKRFRQWGSRTPGHPKHGLTPGVETTTGPLGQGIMNAVGMAIAEAHLAAVFNRGDYDIIDHYTYAFCSEGDMMEGASHEAASLAGHLGLGKLICLYDDNHVSIDGSTDLAYSDDVKRRFEGYRWHVQSLGDKANDVEALTEAVQKAQDVTDRLSLIIVRSHIAYGAPHLQDSPKAHGAPLGDEVSLTKERYGWPRDEDFLVPDRVVAHMGQVVSIGEQREQEWRRRVAAYRGAYPDRAELLELAMMDNLPPGWDDPPQFSAEDGRLATRAASAKVLNTLAAKVPWLMGGAADLASSTKAYIEDGGDFEQGRYAERNVRWGVWEHVMCAASSGMALHGGVRPFASSFFIFTDHARPAMRLCALMELPVIYVMSHDSIGVGEDGPTHQPVEHLASFRAMPNMCVILPADANEVVYAWRAAMLRRRGPTLLVLTRQGVPVFDRRRMAPADGVMKGAYVLSRERGPTPDIILIASGSEVHLALGAQGDLATHHGIEPRVVSMPSWELFREQHRDYRDAVLPPAAKRRLAVEAGASLGWCEWVGDGGAVLGIDRFGASAPADENFHHHGFSVENVVARATRLMTGSGD